MKKGITTSLKTGYEDAEGKEVFIGDLFGELGGDVEKPNEYELHGKVYYDHDVSDVCVELSNGGWMRLVEYLSTTTNPTRSKVVYGNIYEESK